MSTKRVLKKLSAAKIDLAAQSAGFELEGKFIGFSESKPFKVVDEDTGETKEKTLTNAIFEQDDGERLTVIADAGLKGTMSDSLVTVGMKILIRKKDKVKLKGAKTMNQYDIFEVQQ